MTLAQYQTLSGITVSTANTAFVTAQISRTRSMLETMLGFTLSSSKVDTNLYNELGQTTSLMSCPDVDTAELDAPDEVDGAYRLYRYNESDPYMFVDPYVTLYRVKLVYIKQGDGDQGVTLRTFEDDEVRVEAGRDGVSKYIGHGPGCTLKCSCNHNVQLAVDADWMFEDCLPEELKYVWSDMITFYSDKKNKIKSESIDTHSYSKDTIVAPHEEPYNMAIIKRYAGPFGSLMTEPTIEAKV